MVANHAICVALNLDLLGTLPDRLSLIEGEAIVWARPAH